MLLTVPSWTSVGEQEAVEPLEDFAPTASSARLALRDRASLHEYEDDLPVLSDEHVLNLLVGASRRGEDDVIHPPSLSGSRDALEPVLEEIAKAGRPSLRIRREVEALARYWNLLKKTPFRSNFEEDRLHAAWSTSPIPKLTVERLDVGVHLRLRRLTKQWWDAEVPTTGGRWEPLGLRDGRIEVLDTLVTDFAWLLAPRE